MKRVQEYKSTRVQEYKSTRVQEYKSTRVQEYKSTRVRGSKYLLNLSRALLVLLLAGASSAYAVPSVFTADAEGRNPVDTDFWNFEFASGSGFVESITLDLSGVEGSGLLVMGVFVGDLDVVWGFGGNRPAAPGVGTLVGLNPMDLSFNPISGSQLLTLNFAPRTCGAGCSVNFGADTKNKGFTDADDRAHVGTLLTVLLEDGRMGSGIFNQRSGGSSARVEIAANTVVPPVTVIPPVTSIPEPASMLLLGAGLLGLGAARRKKTRRKKTL